MAQEAGKTKRLRKQPPMRKVLIALLPCVAASVYFFGWRSLAVIATANAVGFAVEFCFCRRRNEPVTEAVFVTATLYALILPPSAPWHVTAIGVAFAVMFAKELFGGFGRNIFNPAMIGRCFVYICFPIALTAVWAKPAAGPAGALAQWSTGSGEEGITGATPMADAKAGRSTPVLSELFFGRISGTMGVTSALAILIGGTYLLLSKTANWRIVLTVSLTYGLLSEILHRAGFPQVNGGLAALLGGGFLFGAFFMATDPVSAPKTEEARLLYGILIGVVTVVIRNFSVFNGGFMFALLFANMFGPILDYAVKAYKSRGQGEAKEEGSA